MPLLPTWKKERQAASKTKKQLWGRKSNRRSRASFKSQCVWSNDERSLSPALRVGGVNIGRLNLLRDIVGYWACSIVCVYLFGHVWVFYSPRIWHMCFCCCVICCWFFLSLIDFAPARILRPAAPRRFARRKLWGKSLGKLQLVGLAFPNGLPSKQTIPSGMCRR